MAWSSSAISAATLANRALDKPILVGDNELRTSILDSAEWRQGGLWSAGTDETDDDGPTLAASDGFTGRYTYPDSSQTAWCFMMKWDSPLPTFDMLAIIGHNFGSNDATVVLEIADNDAFDSGLQDLVTFTPSDDTRLVSLTLDHDASGAQRYTGVTRARLKITAAVGFVPQFSELILGTAQQLSFKPDEDYAVFHEESLVDENESLSGVISGVTRFAGRHVLEAVLTLHDDAEATAIQTWWSDCGRGRWPFLWIEAPTTSPEAAALMVLSERIARAPYEASAVRSFEIRAREQAPFFIADEA